jgi:DHA1 family arabinose polymer transporter-like MFS transporter
MFAWISYISPLMTEISHFSQDSVSWIMVLAGFGMIVGNLIGGKLADRFQPVYTCAGLLLCMAVNLLAIHYFSGYQFVSLFLTFMTGALSMMIAAPIQILMINTSGDSEMLGAALIQAAFNVGNSLGAFLGGLPIVMGYGFTYPVVVGACMAVAGVGFAIRLIKMQHPPAGMNADSTTRMAA